MSTSIYTPGSVVPQGADDCVVYSNSPDLDSFGTDDTPAGWPALGCKVTAVEVEMTATDQFTANGQVQVGVFKPDGLDPLDGALSDASGTWSGWDGGVGQYRSSPAESYYLNKFGGWLTDYITWTNSGASVTWLTSTSSVTPGTGVDIRARCRRADWSTGTNLRTICSTSIGLGKRSCALQLTTSDVWITMYNATNTDERTATLPLSSFGEVNGQWIGLRVVTDGTSTATFYQDTSADPTLETWTLVGTASFGGTVWNDVSGTVRVGSTNSNGSGFDGDISHWEIRDGTGAIIHQLALDAMDASADTGWSSPYNSVSRDASGNTCTGATIPATKRVRVDLDTPCPLADFRLIVDAQTGALTVDEILIEAECGGGGIYRDGRVHLS